MAEFQRFIPCVHGYFDSIKTAIPEFGQLEFSFTKVPCGCFTVILLYFFCVLLLIFTHCDHKKFILRSLFPFFFHCVLR